MPLTFLSGVFYSLDSLPGSAYAVIWTTTAWTLPANQALNAHPDLEYALVSTPRGVLLLGRKLAEQALERYGLKGDIMPAP